MSDINTLMGIENWHAAARPSPTERDFNVQLGCHFEEIAEMLETLDIDTEDAAEALYWVGKLARKLKKGEARARIMSPVSMLDALCDQIVTAVGVGYCAGMNVAGAAEHVNQSNWTKFVDGRPVRDENGKIVKGPDYSPPELATFVS